MMDVFSKALAGDREAQLVTMVQTLAAHIGALLLFVPSDTDKMNEFHRATLELCQSAMAYLAEPVPPPYTQDEKFTYGMCDHHEGLLQCILTTGHVERSKTPHTEADGCRMKTEGL